jgi:DNA-binding MurR/RpiR family transcriptional regulator
MTDPFFIDKLRNLQGQVSKKYNTFIRYVSSHPKEIAFMTLTDLSKASGVSRSTIVRFAVALGYEGYPGLRKDFQQMIRSDLTTFERFRLYSDEQKPQKQAKHPFEKTLQTERENLQNLLSSVQQENLKRVIHGLNVAETVFIAGTQSTESIAQYFAYHLSIISDNIRFIQRANGDAISLLKIMNKKSLVFLISLVRYPRALIQIGEWAKAKGAKIVVITDNILSPFKDIGNVFLIVPTTFISFLYTNAALVALLNAIIVAFGSERKKSVVNHLKRWEETHKFHSIFALEKEDEER